MKLKNILIKYPFIPPFLVLASNLISSFLTRFFIGGHIYDMTSAVDNAVPFVPQFIYIYVLAFVQWAVCLIGIMIIDREKSVYYSMGATFANILSGIVFFVIPTVMIGRPEFSGSGALTEFIGKFIFSADTPPMNIFPSLHCLHSWCCLRMVFASKKVHFGLKVSNAVFSVLVFLSVLFVKQHMFVDIPAGIIIFEAGLLIARLIGLR